MIFILGGNGFVGSAFTRYCVKNHIEHRVITRENYETLIGQHCDTFINANGNSKMYLARQEPLTDFDANVRSVYASLINFSCNRYVYLSSCDVYPDFSSAATTREDAIFMPGQQRPYGFHKYLGKLCVQRLAKRWLILRLGGLIGPQLSKNPVFDILNQQPLWLDLQSEMQFIHTDAAARIAFDLLGQGSESEIYNVCGRGMIALNDVVAMAGASTVVREGSPVVKYAVTTEKLAGLVSVPETRATVAQFLRESQALK